MEAADVVAVLGTDARRGLSTTEARRRLDASGPNSLGETARRRPIAIFLDQFRSPLIYLLFAAGGVALAMGHAKDAVVILVVTLINAAIGAFQEGRAERSLAALRRLSAQRARVVRDGAEIVVDSPEVVPGDLAVLGAGDAVSADARLIESRSLAVAEAALTGESVPVEKSPASLASGTAIADRANMLFSGTHVTAGRARAVVVATGRNAEIGRIATMTSSAREPRTPLERRIAQFGKHVLIGACVLFMVILGLGLARGVPWAEIVMIGISQLVGMVPEGLPVAMTIALAVGVQRMASRKAVVRRLVAVETLGSTSVICADKTGTLTRNEMTATTVTLPDGRTLAVTGAGYAPEGEVRDGDTRVDSTHDAALRSLLEALVLCSDATLSPPSGDERAWRPVGDPTEAALLVLARKGGVDPAEVRARAPRRTEIPFDSSTKRMLTQHDHEGGPVVFVKGAPEAVLALCDGSGAALNAARDAAHGMAARALRVLAVAVAPGATIDDDDGGSLSGRFRLLGLVGQVDPPRPEAREAVERCRAAGIRPVMVTGDHKATGLAVARSLGIAGDGDTAIDGQELDALSEAAFIERVGSTSVFARVRPEQKLRIVSALQRRDEVVAMTGDGVNDAPALAQADVGVAMGSGTEVAKEAARVVVTDDDFATILSAVEEGRIVYRNLGKAVLFLLCTSAAEIVVLVGAMVLGFPPPFTAVQILWNNLVTEGLVTVNLVMEPAEGDEMRRRPLPPDEPLLTRPMFARMAIMVPAMVVSTLGWLILRTDAGVPVEQVRTETFTLLVFCEWFNVLNCRSDRRSALTFDLLRNRWLLGGLVAGALLHAAVIYWPPLGRVFDTVPFGPLEALALSALGGLVLVVEEVRKALGRGRSRAARRSPCPAAST
jgi:Ca2+-transporting ATPase